MGTVALGTGTGVEVSLGVSIGLDTAEACAAGTVTVFAVPGIPRPRPAAYKQHNPWLKAGISPNLGWFVNNEITSLRAPRTSSASPCRAFLGPTSTNTRAPAPYNVCKPL